MERSPVARVNGELEGIDAFLQKTLGRRREQGCRNTVATMRFGDNEVGDECQTLEETNQRQTDHLPRWSRPGTHRRGRNRRSPLARPEQAELLAVVVEGVVGCPVGLHQHVARLLCRGGGKGLDHD